MGYFFRYGLIIFYFFVFLLVYYGITVGSSCGRYLLGLSNLVFIFYFFGKNDLVFFGLVLILVVGIVGM